MGSLFRGGGGRVEKVEFNIFERGGAAALAELIAFPQNGFLGVLSASNDAQTDSFRDLPARNRTGTAGKRDRPPRNVSAQETEGERGPDEEREGSDWVETMR